MTALASGLLQLPASELRPGDRVSFGDHTGWYRVRKIEKRIETVCVYAWWNRRGRLRWFPVPKIVLADETAWVQR